MGKLGVSFREINRVSLAAKTGKKSSAYDIVKSFTENTLGKFSKQDALLSCPSLSSSSVKSALKNL